MATRSHALNLVGQRFGRWVVLSKSHKNIRGEIFWTCKCDCGSERAVKTTSLRSGASQSCGCFQLERVTKHGMAGSRTHKSWESMLQRCENPKSPDFHRYGARGIKVHAEWHEFSNFVSSMGERPKGMTLERKDTNGDYMPGNCLWADASSQQRNKRNSIRATMNGVTKSIHDWEAETGIPVGVIKWRLKKGWPDVLALTKFVRPKAPN